MYFEITYSIGGLFHSCKGLANFVYTDSNTANPSHVYLNLAMDNTAVVLQNRSCTDAG